MFCGLFYMELFVEINVAVDLYMINKIYIFNIFFIVTVYQMTK